VLDAGDRRLRAAGFTSRSAFLTSSTAGGSSWLAHATLLSGLWIDNQQRYDELATSHRLTLTRAFQRANWRTVGVMPGNDTAWAESGSLGYDQIYGAKDMGYQGPRFSWASMPDQYALSKFEGTERSPRDHPPVMAEITLVSSHAPWEPIPRLVSWHHIGDGSLFDTMAAPGDPPEAILTRNPTRVRAAYRSSIEYSLSTLISYVETYGDDNLVLVFLGDHQPSPIVTGRDASRDVPISIVARDPSVFERIAPWAWQEGLQPDPQAPVWRMDAFRDRFLTAFNGASPANPSPPVRAVKMGVSRGNLAVGIPIGISIGKTKKVPLDEAVEDYLASLRTVARYADYLAINVSSPNTPGLRTLQDARALAELISALVNEAWRLAAGAVPVPIFVKLAPDLTEGALEELVGVCTEVGAEGLIATNTTLGRDGVSADQPLAAEAGGLSGAPLARRARQVVRFLADRTTLPIIGVGGIMSRDDGQAMLDAGASLLQIYTGYVYRGPALVADLNRLRARRHVEGAPDQLLR
jgi:dihydroorotate dehydrogenase